MKRFTLVELMIVVAIIAVLAAIAIPAFYEMQLKSKRAELPVNGDGITNAVDAYMMAEDPDSLLMWLESPRLAPDKTGCPLGAGQRCRELGRDGIRSGR